MDSLTTALSNWTLSEARWYAYKAALGIHDGLVFNAKALEDDLKETWDTKVDLYNAADYRV